jgi:hypothetical protein
MASVRGVLIIVSACIALNAWLAFLALTRAHPLASVVSAIYLAVTVVVLIGLAGAARHRFVLSEATSLHMSLRCGGCGGSVVFRDIRRGTFERLLLPLVGLHPFCCLHCGFRAYLREVAQVNDGIA